MSEKKKGKFFLELDEDQGVWLVGKDKKQAPPADTPAPEAPVAPEAPAPAPQVAQAAPSDPLELIRAAVSASSPAAAEPQPSEPDVTFAVENPLPLVQPGRRSPGPSLDMFKDMARQVGRSKF